MAKGLSDDEIMKFIKSKDVSSKDYKAPKTKITKVDLSKIKTDNVKNTKTDNSVKNKVLRRTLVNTKPDDSNKKVNQTIYNKNAVRTSQKPEPKSIGSIDIVRNQSELRKTQNELQRQREKKLNPEGKNAAVETVKQAKQAMRAVEKVGENEARNLIDFSRNAYDYAKAIKNKDDKKEAETVSNMANAFDRSLVGRGIKTAGNFATRTGHGALKGADWMLDWGIDKATSKPLQYARFAEKLLNPDKKEEINKKYDTIQNYIDDYTKQDLADITFKELGWDEDTYRTWEKGSLVNRNNLGGQISETMGEQFLPLLLGSEISSNLVGNSIGNKFAGTKLSKATAGLTGTNKYLTGIKTVGENAAKFFIKNAPSMMPFWTTSYGGALEEALNEGATREEARRYATASAAVETGTEMMFDGIPAIKGSSSTADAIANGLIDKATGKITNKFAKQVVSYLARMGYVGAGEGAEEMVSEILNPLLKNYTYSNGEKIDWKQVLQSGMMGFISGEVMGAQNTFEESRNAVNNQINRETFQNSIQNTVNNAAQTTFQEITSQLDQLAQQRVQQIDQAVQQGQMTPQEGTQEIENIQRYVDAQKNTLQQEQQPQQNQNNQLAQQAVQQINQQVQSGQISPQDGIQQIEDIQNYLRAQEAQTEQQQSGNLVEDYINDNYGNMVEDYIDQNYGQQQESNLVEDYMNNGEDNLVNDYMNDYEDGNMVKNYMNSQNNQTQTQQENVSNQNNIENTQQKEYNKAIKEEGAENEFRRLQEESRNISNEEQQSYRRGSKEIDEDLRRRLSRALGQRVESSRSSNSNNARVLKDNKSGNTFEIYDNVDGQTFRDVFEIARTYTKNGELVDLHPVVTNEDAVGYNDTKNFVTKDGLSGYAITKDGDLISVFNANNKRGWLRAIEPDIRKNAKTLDCYMSENQPLHEMYEKIFGFKTASVMDYNMEYDHDDIAKNHNMPQVAFMVKTDQDIETKHFNKDQYDEALEYRNSLVDNQGTSDSSFSNEQTNIPEAKNEESIKIELTGVPKNQIKTESTGISIGNKPVQIEVPINSSQNKLGQYVPKDGFTKKELKNGKIGDSKFYKNVTERADFISDEVREQVQSDDYIKHHRKITNDESMQMAFDDLNTRGTEAIADFFNNDKELTSKDTAMGWLLIEQSQANGDYNFSNQVLRKMRSSATKTGQAMQMYNYYARLTPEGMYRWCGDQLLRAEEIFEKNKTKKWIEANKNRWQLNGEEVEFIKDQMEKIQKLNKMNDSDTTTIDIKGKPKKVTVDRAKQVEIAKIQAMIEDKIPHQKGQALNAWMRISMLGNLKTIGTRNPLGNVALRPVNDAGDFVASLVDYAISKKTGVRTKGNLNLKAQAKGFKKGSSEAVQDFRLGIDTKNQKGNRFEIGQGKSFNEKHTGVTKVLNPLSKVGNKADTGVSFLLDLGDRPFYEAAYAQSLENQMKLNGIEKAEDAPEWMKKIAEQEALERTYQDDNNYTAAVVDIRKAMNKFNVKGYGLGDVIIPFAKTPANLTKAIVDYSPAGFVSALTKGNELRTAINNEQFTPEMQHRFVNQLGKATAGTILYVMGAALANSGLITGGADEDKDVADFMRNTLGIQPYSIKIGNKSFTYDWAQPVASSFAIPADIKKGIQDAKNQEVDLQYIIHKSFNTAGNILLEQSFLQGIKEVLGGYGDPLDNLMSEIEGLPARAVPTLFQQIVTYFDSTKKMSYGNKGIQNVISQAIAKTPFAKELPVYRNTMGKEVKMYGGKNNFFNVFINPSNYSEGNATKSAEEIYAIYQATNDKTILPRTVGNDLRNEDGTKLTNQQKSDFLKISGDFIDENVEKLTESNEYKNMSNEDKAATIKYIVDYAYNKARKEITGHKLSSEHQKTENAEKSGYTMADYFISKKVNKKETSKSTTSRNRYEELQQKGIDGRTFDDFVSFVKKTKGDSKKGGLSKKQKIINYIQSLPLSAKQKQSLWEDYKENNRTYSSYN